MRVTDFIYRVFRRVPFIRRFQADREMVLFLAAVIALIAWFAFWIVCEFLAPGHPHIDS